MAKTIYRYGRVYTLDKECGSHASAKLREQELWKQGKHVLRIRGPTLYKDAEPGQRHSVELYVADRKSGIELLEERYRTATFPQNPNYWASGVSANGVDVNDPAVKAFARKRKLRLSAGTYYLPVRKGKTDPKPVALKPTKKQTKQTRSRPVKQSKSFSARANRMSKLLKRIYEV